jgi:flagellar export protein FliJ
VKRFEFRLQRVLDLRRQQAEAQRAQLRNLLTALDRLQHDIRSLATQLEEARAHVRHAPSSAGEDYIALSYFEAHVQRRATTLETRRHQLHKQVAEQRAHLLEAERKLKLLEKLEARHRLDWTAERDKEIETLGAESHLSRMQSYRRQSAI